jgi:hypothetical protein
MFDRLLRLLLRSAFVRRTLLHAANLLGPSIRELRFQDVQVADAPDSNAPATALAESVDIPEVTPLSARPAENAGNGVRLNLLVPGLSERHVFGGIATALQFFDRLREGTPALRILVLDEVQIAPRKDAFYSDWPVFSLADLADQDPVGPHIVVCGDRYGHTLPVHQGDRFVATIWWSAHLVHQLLDWQHEQLGLGAPRFVYFIQDYEPGFYPWSSRFALADATYRRGERTIAVINTRLLADFLASQKIAFDQRWLFEPQLNPGLRAAQSAVAGGVKERLVLVYGRPGTERNAFALLVAGLRAWVAMQADAPQWKLVSAGEAHAAVDLGRNVTLMPMGKLSLAHYAEMLGRAAVGISLMISPHPSYPPLEMAAFGCLVVTNRFANKDLSALCPSITCTERLDATGISEALVAACVRAAASGFAPQQPDGLAAFIGGADPFSFAAEVREALAHGKTQARHVLASA